MTARILLVEDDANLRRVLQVKLSRAGFEVHAAEDGRSAIALAQQHPPHVIVCDYRLPDTTAVELAAAIRRHSDAPLLLITAYEDPSTELHIARIAPASVLYKPFDLDQLVKRVRAALAVSTDRGMDASHSQTSSNHQKAERRQFTRRIWVTDASVATAEKDVIRVATCDVGLGGLAVVGERQISPGDSVTVEWAAWATATPIRVEGRVAHCEPVLEPLGHTTYRLGIAFDFLPESARAAIFQWTSDISPA